VFPERQQNRSRRQHGNWLCDRTVIGRPDHSARRYGAIHPMQRTDSRRATGRTAIEYDSCREVVRQNTRTGGEI